MYRFFAGLLAILGSCAVLLILVVLAIALYTEARTLYTEARTELVALVFQAAQIGTVLSLLLALYQLRQVGSTNRSLRDISESMSTKFTGKFPDHIPEITRLLRTAKKGVTIVCDLLGYGYYSSPERYQEYRAAVLGLSSDVDVKITVYGKERASRAAKEQLGTSFDDIRRSSTYQSYVRYYNIVSNEAPKNIDEFYALWDQNYDKHYSDFNIKDIVINQVRHKAIPVYFWIIDDRVAVFSFPSLSIEPPEVAFRTSDRNLIEIFKRVLTDVEPTPMNLDGGNASKSRVS